MRFWCFSYAPDEPAQLLGLTKPSLLICTQNMGVYKSKEGCKYQESIQSSTTPDPGYQWESDKLTVDTTNDSQEVSPFPAGDHKAQIN